MARMVRSSTPCPIGILTCHRTADQSDGNKTVGVDPTVITARMKFPEHDVAGGKSNTVQLKPESWQRRSRRKAVLALLGSRRI